MTLSKYLVTVLALGNREPRGFAFVQFVDSYDAAEAQYHMNGQVFAGREISVVVAAETRKRPEEMRRRTGPRGSSSRHGGRRSHYALKMRHADGLGLAQYHVRVLHLTLLVLEVVITQGPSLLLQDVELTTPFPQTEGMQTTLDHQEKIQKSEMVAIFADRIPIGIILIRLEMEIDTTSKWKQ
ncbi:hypothetical protein C3L33_16678, partial [Rhododendron williamsianum]